MNINNWNEKDRLGYLKRIERRARNRRKVNSLTSRIESFKANGESVHSIVSAYIYIIENSAFKNWYKIGTCVDIDKRLQTYQTSDPMRGYVIRDKWITRNRHDIEKIFLEYAARSSLFEVKGEWIYAEKYSLLKNKLQNLCLNKNPKVKSRLTQSTKTAKLASC